MSDAQFVSEVLRNIPLRVDNTLLYTRNQLLGPCGGDRDDYDPRAVLSHLDSDGTMVVMDTAQDLPENWSEMSFEDLLKKRGQDNADAEADLVSSDDGATSEEVKYFSSIFLENNLILHMI